MNQKTSILLVLGCTLASILLILSFDAPRNSSGLPPGHDMENYNNSWSLAVDGGPQINVSLPTKTGALAGQTVTLEHELPDTLGAESWMCIRTNQHFVRAFINDTQVYTYGYNSKSDLPFASAPGNTWNFIPLSPGTTLRLELTSPLSTHAGVVNTAVVGSWGALWQSRLFVVLPSALISFSFMLISLVLILISFYLRHSTNGGTMAYLGLFCLIASTWSLIQSRAPDLLFPKAFAISQLGYLCLLACPFPLLMFMRGYLNLKNHRICSALLSVGGLAAVVTLALYLFGLATLVHLMLVCVIIIIFFTAYIICRVTIYAYRIKTSGRALLVLAVISLAAGVIADLINTSLITSGRAVIFADSAFFSRMGFVLFVTLLTVLTVRQGAYIYSRGLEADMIQKMMETDLMTGLFNRQTYDFALEEIYAKGPPHGLAMILLDMNNLKTVNDKHGHKEGDKLIQTTTRLMQEAFSSHGRCYRIGGDEFIALLQDISLEDLDEILNTFREMVQKFNSYGGLQIDVAIGHDFYSIEWDKDVYAFFNRVDGAMYQDKRVTKSTTAPK